MDFIDVTESCIKFIIVDYNAKLKISAINCSYIYSEQELETKTKLDVPEVCNLLPSVCCVKILQKQNKLLSWYWPNT
jgi:hypothetical protein